MKFYDQAWWITAEKQAVFSFLECFNFIKHSFRKAFLSLIHYLSYTYHKSSPSFMYLVISTATYSSATFHCWNRPILKLKEGSWRWKIIRWEGVWQVHHISLTERLQTYLEETWRDLVESQNWGRLKTCLKFECVPNPTYGYLGRM